MNSFARTQIPVPDNLPGTSRSKNVYARYISKSNHNRLSLPMCRHSSHSGCSGGSETGVDDATYGGIPSFGRAAIVFFESLVMRPGATPNRN